MRKIMIFSFILFSICLYNSFSATTIQVVYGDLKDTISTPLGPGFTCEPSTNICISYASLIPFGNAMILENIGIFIPTVPSNPPTVGKGYTDVNVRRTILPNGSQRFDIEVNPGNIMFYDYQAWKNFFERK